MEFRLARGLRSALWGVLVLLIPPSEWPRGVRGAEEQQCSPSTARSTDSVGADMRRLRNDLLCDYDRLIVKPRTEVEIDLFVYRLDLDVHRGLLQMMVGFNWRWHDSRLSWDPSSYSSLGEVVFTEKEIWIPDIEALNSMQRDFKTLRCTVASSGNVTCHPLYNLHTTCGNSARHWPMDEHECVFELASRNHDSREYTITIPANTTDGVVSSEASHEWVVVRTAQSRQDAPINENFHFARLEVRLTLRRNSRMHAMTVGMPTVVLPCLVLAQLWVDPRWPGRLLLGCVTVASLCLYLQYLSDTVPDDTQGSAPLIVLFYRDSLVVAVLVVLLTVALRGLCERCDAPPPWLTGGSSWLLRAVPRPVVTGMLLEEEDDDEEEEEQREGRHRAADTAVEAVDTAEQASKGEELPGAASWRRIARLVDRLAFLALTVTFAALFFAEAP